MNKLYGSHFQLVVFEPEFVTTLLCYDAISRDIVGHSSNSFIRCTRNMPDVLILVESWCSPSQTVCRCVAFQYLNNHLHKTVNLKWQTYSTRSLDKESWNFALTKWATLAGCVTNTPTYQDHGLKTFSASFETERWRKCFKSQTDHYNRITSDKQSTIGPKWRF